MFTPPPATEQIYQISDQDAVQVLQEQFGAFYLKICEYKLVPNAAVETNQDMQRYLSGIPMHNFNAIVGCPHQELDVDKCIEEQLAYFNSANLPFIWYVNENTSQKFKDKLKQHGFVDWGVFRGVIGLLNLPIEASRIPDDCVLERVNDPATFEEFNDVVCGVFGIEGVTKDMCKTVLDQMSSDNPQMFHWVARRQGKVVSAVSTLIIDNVVSFWNGATLPEWRKQGLSTALRRFALHDGILRGSKFGSSYLMGEGLAYGICSKLGYQTKWRFNAFLSPAAK